MVFMHMPISQFASAYNAWAARSFVAEIGTGEPIREPISFMPNAANIFNSIIELESTTHVFAGHDHLNNYSINYQGVRLTSVLKTGNRSRSAPDLNGGTLITINSERAVVIKNIIV